VLINKSRFEQNPYPRAEYPVTPATPSARNPSNKSGFMHLLKVSPINVKTIFMTFTRETENYVSLHV